MSKITYVKATYAKITYESKLLFSFALLSWLAIGFLLLLSRVDIDIISFLPLLVLPVVLYSAAIFYLHRDEKLLSSLCEAVAAGWMLLIPVLASTYLSISLNMPLVDQKLIAMDQVLGFDWQEFIRAVDAIPILVSILDFCYTSFEYQIFAVSLLLIIMGQTNRAYAFVCGYGIVCFISSFIAIWYPALGAYAYLGLDQIDLVNINTRIGFNFLDSFNAVRSPEPFLLSLGVASGIITFPSVHVGIALLLIWAMWESGFLRYVFLLLNIAMTVSAITHGSHYLADAIMGAGVTGLTISIVSYFFLKKEIGSLKNLPDAVSD